MTVLMVCVKSFLAKPDFCTILVKIWLIAIPWKLKQDLIDSMILFKSTQNIQLLIMMNYDKFISCVWLPANDLWFKQCLSVAV